MFWGCAGEAEVTHACDDVFDVMNEYRKKNITHRFSHFPVPHGHQMTLLNQTTPPSQILNPPSHGNATLQQGEGMRVIWRKPWMNSIWF